MTRPADHLRAKAHHQQERRGFRIAKRLVFEIDAVGVRSWHAPQS